jgi:hypothetical protein
VFFSLLSLCCLLPPSSKQELKLQKQSIIEILEFGKETNIISISDFNEMQPNEKPENE